MKILKSEQKMLLFLGKNKNDNHNNDNKWLFTLYNWNKDESSLLLQLKFNQLIGQKREKYN